MRNYNTLTLIAGLFKAIGILIPVLTIVGLILALRTAEFSDLMLYVVGAIVVDFIVFLVFYGIGEGIQLVINVAKDIETTTNNTYIIATQKENAHGIS